MNMQGMLNSLLQGSTSGSAKRGNVLEQLAGSLLGGTNSSTGGIAGLAGSLLGGKNASVGGIGALAGSLLGGGTGAMKGAVGGGALAMLGSLAFKAYQNSQQSGSDQPMDSKTQLMAGMRAPESPEEEEEVSAMVTLMLKAMINAAKADGNIDDEEMNKIVGKAKEDGMSDVEQNFIMEEINKPMDTPGLISAASSNPQVAAQVYTASLLAIEVDTEEEKAYLKELAAGLGLSDNVVNYLDSTVG